MQELVGRLTTLDPAASESLKVVTYFDALVQARAGRLALLRTAARLTGCPAGCRWPDESTAWRVAPEGHRLPDGTPSGWPTRRLAGGGRVWLERGEVPHPAEQMVLERLTLAMDLLDGDVPAGRGTHPALTLVDARAGTDERLDAALSLRLRPEEPVRAAVAAPGAAAEPGLPETGTPWGPVRVAILRRGATWTTGPAGIGWEGVADELPASFSSALVALRARRPLEAIGQADELGAVVALVEAVDAGGAEPVDVRRVRQLSEDVVTARVLDALADFPSLRSAATALGMHHSSLQARVDQIAGGVGFDVTTPHGRTRLDLALALTRARRARWGEAAD